MFSFLFKVELLLCVFAACPACAPDGVASKDGIRRCRMTSLLARHSSSELGSALALKDGAKVLGVEKMGSGIVGLRRDKGGLGWIKGDNGAGGVVCDRGKK